MTALAEALLAAQRQAIGALAKPFIAGLINADEVTARLATFGCDEIADRTQLLAAWHTIAAYGAPAPRATQPEPRNPDREPPSESQKKYLSDLAHERGVTLPDYALTKASASKLIEQLRANTYNPDEWTVPF